MVILAMLVLIENESFQAFAKKKQKIWNELS